MAGSVAVSERISSVGYSGETFDAKVGQQYLRARFYNPTNGRFNRLDDFSGNNQDPQSLHKYAYVHGDPIGGVDPSGKFYATLAISTIAFSAAAFAGLGAYFAYHSGYDIDDWQFWGAIAIGAAFGALWGFGALSFGIPTAIVLSISISITSVSLISILGGLLAFASYLQPEFREISPARRANLDSAISYIGQQPGGRWQRASERLSHEDFKFFEYSFGDGLGAQAVSYGLVYPWQNDTIQLTDKALDLPYQLLRICSCSRALSHNTRPVLQVHKSRTRRIRSTSGIHANSRAGWNGPGDPWNRNWRQCPRLAH